MAVKRCRLKVLLEVLSEADSPEVGTPTSTVIVDYDRTFLSGTGQSQVNAVFRDERTYTASTAVDHDVAPYTDEFGTSTTLAKAKVAVLQTLNTTSGQQWQFGGDAANVIWFGAAADYLKLGPDGIMVICDPIDGIAVTATSADIVQVTPPAAAVAAKLVVVGNT